MARADSPKDLLPMSAYGKGQPPQLHGMCIWRRSLWTRQCGMIVYLQLDRL